MGINKNFMVLFAILLLVISILPNIYSKSDKLSQETALSEVKIKEQEIKVEDKTDMPKENKYKTELKLNKNTSNEITLDWDYIDKVDGYIISRSRSYEGEYEEVYTSESKDIVKYTDIELNSGSPYYYKINTYILENNEKIIGPDSEVCITYTITSTPEIYVKSYNEEAIKIAWESSDEVDGYEIYRAKNNDGNFYISLDADKNYYSRFIDREVDRGREYSYKVRTYKYINGEKIYGEFSRVSSIYVEWSSDFYLLVSKKCIC